MKKLLVVALSVVIIMGIGIGSSSAQTSMTDGKIGISVGLGNSIFGDTDDSIIDISGRYRIANDIALLAGFGFETHSGDADGSYFSISVGARKYISTNDVAPFIDGKLSYVTQDVIGDTDIIDFTVGFGAEYFLHKQFSVEGSIGIGFGVEDNNDTNDDDIYFGTRSIGVRANFYF